MQNTTQKQKPKQNLESLKNLWLYDDCVIVFCKKNVENHQKKQSGQKQLIFGGNQNARKWQNWPKTKLKYIWGKNNGLPVQKEKYIPGNNK